MQNATKQMARWESFTANCLIQAIKACLYKYANEGMIPQREYLEISYLINLLIAFMKDYYKMPDYNKINDD